MTDPIEDIEAPPEAITPASPVPVAVDTSAGPMPVVQAAAGSGNGNTITIPAAVGATFMPISVAPYDPKRRRLLILVSGTGPAWFGTMAECQQVLLGNTQGGGFMVPTGLDPVELCHIEQLYVTSDGVNAVTISVWVERDRS